MTKRYIGDSVYARHIPQESAIVLTTENGLPNDPSNEIYLEREVLEALVLFAKQVELLEVKR